MSIPYVNQDEYDKLIKKLRYFFDKKEFKEVYTQNRIKILNACEDPQSISTFEFAGEKWPLPQTQQMWLEYELMNSDTYGVYTIGTSYRYEKNPIKDRHHLVFPMFEFEFRGTMEDLLVLEMELLEYLGYGKADSFPQMDYLDICKMFGLKANEELTHKHEEMLMEKFGHVFFIKNFPEYTSPFWNMLRNSDDKQTSRKIDVCLSGMETIGSAERSSDIKDMKNRFYTISDGQYAKLLFDEFGKDRVEEELEEFFKLKFCKRVGAGCGLTRLISSMKKLNLL
jgi:aspartyl/asparaginyl-tRNA synthetase